MSRRSRGNRRARLCCCSSMYVRQNAGPEPASVTPYRVSGRRPPTRSNASTMTSRLPAISEMINSDDATDMGVGEDQRHHVVVGQPPGFDHSPRRRGDGGVGMLRALGIRCRSRRVEDPTQISARRRGRRRGQCRRIAVGQRAIDSDQRRRLVHRGRGTRRQIDVVGASPHARHQHQRRSRLTRDESDLALAIDGDQRDLDRAEARQRRAEHE